MVPGPPIWLDERGTLEGAQISGLVATLRTKGRMGFEHDRSLAPYTVPSTPLCMTLPTPISGALQVVGEQELEAQLGLVRTFSDQGSEGLACDRWLPINLSGGSRCTAGVDLLG